MSDLYDSRRKKIDIAFLKFTRSLLSSEGQEKIAKDMFKELKKHIGEEVKYIGWWYGCLEEEKGELKEVNDFDGVVVGNIRMPFVGCGAAITSITSKDNETLYFNPFVEDNYDRRDDVEVDAAIRTIFGDRIVQKKQAIRKKHEKKRAALLKKQGEMKTMMDEKNATNSVDVDIKNK